MPQFDVKTEITDSTSATVTNEYDQAIAQLRKIKTDIDNLLADGYRTPAAETKFRPFFESFHKGYNDVIEGLPGISQYVKSVGEGFTETDTQLGNSLPH
ncbi:WXG100 family type VII secretion target [Streptomyces sp. NPDC088354]|uniref:WXG100 family type VII secretion target n=1 Tax=unclassified Streptomyces TaxID=2593676 RepID=UPI0029BEAEC9|nr:WXG100 family type VII secretion target [Streptomyces sp. MI02-7b]MDX3072422.1 WXG100 family type VII secretion target [Streptomyces sp. MI02-7b]